MPHIDVNGQSIHYTDSGGDGPPVVFTGALMCDTVVLQPLADTLAEAGYRTVAYDGRAQGLSRFDGEEYNFIDAAHDMLGLAGALGFERAIFGGELIGATLGLQAAILAPERVIGLLLIGPTADASDPGEKSAVHAAMDVWNDAGPVGAAYGYVAEAITGSHETAMALLERWATWSHLSYAARAWLSRPDMVNDLPSITCPAAVIHGRNEFYVPLKHGEKVAENLGGSTKFETIDGSRQALSLVQFPEALDAVHRLMGDLFPV